MKFKFGLIFSAVLAMAGFAQAQVIYDNGVTNTEPLSINYGVTNIYIGINTNNTALEVVGSGGLSGTGYYDVWGEVAVGLTSSSENNSLIVDYASFSIWPYLGGEKLIIGNLGSGNHLSIINDGVVSSPEVIVGSGGTADNNDVNINHSRLNTDLLKVGYAGSDNSVNVLNEAGLRTLYTWVGYTNNANNNQMFLSDAGTSWTNYNTIYVGSATNTGNRVVVTNGAEVVAGNLVIDGTDNSFDLENGGRLILYSDFDVSVSGFNFNDAGSLWMEDSVLSGMTNYLEGGRGLGISGTNGSWDVSGSNVFVGAASSNNSLTVTQDAQMLADSLSVGGVSNSSGNSVVVSDGGTIALENGLDILGADNTFTVGDGGWLSISNDFDASQSGFTFGPGGTFEIGGTLTGMAGSIESNRTVRLNGGDWNLGASDLEVGASSSFNNLYLTNGATLTSASAFIGTGGSNNLVEISGAGSVWTTTGDMTLSGTDNMMRIFETGSIDVGQTLTVSEGATLTFESGGTAEVNSYFQTSNTVFSFDSVTNATDATEELLTVNGTATLESGAGFEYSGDLNVLETGKSYTNMLISAGTLISTNLSGSLDQLLLKLSFYESNNDLFATIQQKSLADAAEFEAGSDMEGVANEINDLAAGNNAAAANQIELINDSITKGEVLNAELSQLYDRSAPTYVHVGGMLEGFRQARQRGIMPETYWPGGPRGPHYHGEQVQGWIKGYGSWGGRDDDADLSGYDHTIYGVVVGIDKSFGDLLAGLAGGYAVSDVSQDDGDSSEATTGYGLLYASWGTVDWFADANLGLGLSSIENDSGTMFDTKGSTDAQQLAYYIGGGKELVFSDDKWFVTPSAGLQGSLYMQDSYTESGTNAVSREVDSYDYWSMQTELGVKVSYQKESDRRVWMPEAHLNWLHELNGDEPDIGYSLVGGSDSYTMDMQAPVQDLFEVGFGVSIWTETKGRNVLEWAFGVDSRFGDGYTATAFNARMLYEF